MGSWADGMITVVGERESMRKILDAFREGGGEGKPVLAQLKLAWGPDEAAIREDAFHQWRTNLFEGDVLWEIRTPKQFEQAAAFVRPEDLDKSVRVSSDLDRHAAWIRDYLAVGIDELSLHNVATNQRAFLEAFGERVLPQLHGA
jgi:hypothetical protein